MPRLTKTQQAERESDGASINTLFKTDIARANGGPQFLPVNVGDGAIREVKLHAMLEALLGHIQVKHHMLGILLALFQRQDAKAFWVIVFIS